MATFRTVIVIDFDVEDETDPDIFHDALRDALEDRDTEAVIDGMMTGVGEIAIETVRSIEVDVLA